MTATVESVRVVPRAGFHTNERHELLISVEDRERTNRRGLGVRGEVTDLKTGKRYRIKGASCGLPFCQCDAVAEEIQ